jgi:hypothetical protein
MSKDDKVRQELGTTRVRDGSVIYFGSDGASWISRDISTGDLTIHFADGTELTTATGGPGIPDPVNMDFSSLPLADPHVAGKAFIDANGKVTISSG